MKRFDSSTGQAGVSQTGGKVLSKGDKEVGTSSSAWTDPSTHQVELRNRLVSVEDYEPLIVTGPGARPWRAAEERANSKARRGP